MATKDEIDAAVALIDRVLQRAGVNDTGKEGGAYERLRWLATIARSAAPSWRVAEDVDLIMKTMCAADEDLVPTLAPARDALSRLAAGLQRTEQAEQERDEWKARWRTAHDKGAKWCSLGLTAERERDTLRAEVERLRAALERRTSQLADANRDAAEQRKQVEKAEAQLADVRARSRNEDELARQAEAGWVGVDKWDSEVDADMAAIGVRRYLRHAIWKAVGWLVTVKPDTAADMSASDAAVAALDHEQWCQRPGCMHRGECPELEPTASTPGR